MKRLRPLLLLLPAVGVCLAPTAALAEDHLRPVPVLLSDFARGPRPSLVEAMARDERLRSPERLAEDEATERAIARLEAAEALDEQ